MPYPCLNMGNEESILVVDDVKEQGEITEYLECSLITKDEECSKKYVPIVTKRK